MPEETSEAVLVEGGGGEDEAGGGVHLGRDALHGGRERQRALQDVHLRAAPRLERRAASSGTAKRTFRPPVPSSLSTGWPAARRAPGTGELRGHHAIEGRHQRGILEVLPQLGRLRLALELAPGPPPGGLGGALLVAHLVQLLLGIDAQLQRTRGEVAALRRPGLGEGDRGGALLGARALEGGLGGGQLLLQRARVEPGEHLARVHGLADLDARLAPAASRSGAHLHGVTGNDDAEEGLVPSEWEAAPSTTTGAGNGPLPLVFSSELARAGAAAPMLPRQARPHPSAIIRTQRRIPCLSPWQVPHGVIRRSGVVTIYRGEV